jgi:molybdopterin-guanine dinucleotide biosynthesis protein B
MRIFAFVGSSGSGKTRLIAQLIPELKKRGRDVAVLKHCPHGFSLDPEGKDSRRFFEAGADGVALVSSDRTVVFKKDGKTADFRSLARLYFEDIDILLVEGGRSQKGLKKIEVMGADSPSRPKTPAGELVAVIADYQVKCGRPVFRRSQVKEICRFLEGQPEEKEPYVFLKVDGASVPLNAFVQRVSANVILSLVQSLRGVKDNPKRITLTVIEGGTDNEST